MKRFLLLSLISPALLAQEKIDAVAEGKNISTRWAAWNVTPLHHRMTRSRRGQPCMDFPE